MERVQNEMVRRVAVAFETDTLPDAFLSMNTLGVRHLPVVREGKLVGILSDRDLLRFGRELLNGQFKVPNTMVADVMTRTVFVCKPQDTIAHCADLMLKHKIDSLPVVDEKEILLGIVTSTDLLRLLRDQEWDPAKKLPWTFEPVHFRQTGTAGNA